MFSIAPYRIVVLNKDGRTTRLWSDDLQSGLSTWMHDVLSEVLGNVYQHAEIRRSRISRVTRNNTGEVISGVIQTGINGYSSDLVDTETGLVSHHRTVKEAEFIPFYFLFICPRGGDFGLLLLQRFRNLGVKDFFVDPLIEKFSDSKPEFRLRITRLVPSDLAHQLLNQSAIKTIRLIRYEDPGDVADALGQGYAERTSVVEMVFKAKKNGKLPSSDELVQALMGTRAITSVYSLDSFSYDSIKIDVEYNGKRRVIDIGRPNILTPNVDITDELQLGIGGHPTWESLSASFLSFAVDSFSKENVDISNIDANAVSDDEADPLPEDEDL